LQMLVMPDLIRETVEHRGPIWGWTSNVRMLGRFRVGRIILELELRLKGRNRRGISGH
jgi:hypothetical protein